MFLKMALLLKRRIFFYREMYTLAYCGDPILKPSSFLFERLFLLPSVLTLSVPDEGYFRNTSQTLN